MLAIDFGTARIKIAYLHNNDVHLAPMGKGNLPYLPSLFYVAKDGSILIGEEAEEMLSVDSKGVIPTLKRKMRESRIRKNRNTVSPTQLLVEMFQTIRQRCANELPHVFTEAPNEVALTYPAKYTQIERNILSTAANQAGFTSVNFISEPEAAALTWKVRGNSALDSSVVVILDCGGGTADWACLTNDNGDLRLYSELPEGGDSHLGGHDVDDQLFKLLQIKLEDAYDDESLDVLKDEQSKIMHALKSMKEKFSTIRKGAVPSIHRSVWIGSKKIEFTEDEIQGVISESVLQNLVVSMNDYLDRVRFSTNEQNPIVLLVGGTGKLKGLKEQIEQKCNVKVVWWMESEFATVQGALYRFADFEESEETEVEDDEELLEIDTLVYQLRSIQKNLQTMNSMSFVQSFLEKLKFDRAENESKHTHLLRLRSLMSQYTIVQESLQHLTIIDKERQQHKEHIDAAALKTRLLTFKPRLQKVANEEARTMLQSLTEQSLSKKVNESSTQWLSRLMTQEEQCVLIEQQWMQLQTTLVQMNKKLKAEDKKMRDWVYNTDSYAAKLELQRLLPSISQVKSPAEGAQVMVQIQSTRLAITSLLKDPMRASALSSDPIENKVLHMKKDGVPVFQMVQFLVKEHGFSLGQAGMFVKDVKMPKSVSEIHRTLTAPSPSPIITESKSSEINTTTKTVETGAKDDLLSVVQRMKANGTPVFKMVQFLVKEHGYSLGEAGVFVKRA